MSAMLIQSCLTLCDPMDYIAHRAPLSMEFSRQEYWRVAMPFSKGSSQIKPKSPAAPTLQVVSLEGPTLQHLMLTSSHE